MDIHFDTINIEIRKATKDDYKGRGYVLYKAWKETYKGLISQQFIEKINLESCVRKSKENYKDVYIAVVNNRIIGFASCVDSQEEDLRNSGEIKAIYLLREYQRLGIGKRLMDKCIEELKGKNKVCVWVLHNNLNAFNFYKKYGFRLDGKEKTNIRKNTKFHEVRMILESR